MTQLTEPVNPPASASEPDIPRDRPHALLWRLAEADSSTPPI